MSEAQPSGRTRLSGPLLYDRISGLYDRLFAVPNPGQERDYIEDINPASKTVIRAQLEPALKDAAPEDSFQFERHGYFVADTDT